MESSAPSPIRCNNEPCPPAWDFRWTDCSSTCGDGVQQYVPECKQDLVTGMVPVSESLCPKPKPVPQTRSCRKTNCENRRDNELTEINKESRGKNEWSVENWSQVNFVKTDDYLTFSFSYTSSNKKLNKEKLKITFSYF